MDLYGIVGPGGFGREIIPVAREMIKTKLRKNNFELVFIDQMKKSESINNYRIMSPDEFFSYKADNKFFNIAIANSIDRKTMAELMIRNSVEPFSIYASNFIELDCNQIESGAIFCPFTMITSNAKIGKYFHANIYSYIAHDCIIGDYVTFAPNVNCNGNIIIEDHVYVGTNVVIKQGSVNKPIIIGEGAVLGMGAVVTKSVLPHETVIGNPARPFQKQNGLFEKQPEKNLS